MAKLQVELAGGRQIARGTWAFRFDLGGQELSYRPGQTIDLTYANLPYPDPTGNQRTFSIASAPGGESLMIATRVRGSGFKRSLVDAPPGTPLEIDGPYGSFTLPQRPISAVLLAGGIGITPFRAMVEDAVGRRLEHSIVLIHSNRSLEEAPFFAELERWGRESGARFEYRPTMTQAGPDWAGERRRVGRELLEEWLPQPADRNAPLYYAAGPEGFVKAAVESLGAVGVEEDRIRFEEFPGY